MRFPKLAILALALALSPAAARAASFNVTVLDTGFKVCSAISAATPKAAFIACLARLGIVVPPADAVVTATQVCKSTHLVARIGGSPSFAYDRRLSYVTRPSCPG